MSTSKFTATDAFFVNVNKSSVLAIVPEQSESASFVMLEIHNVDVPVASSRDATVLSPITGTLQLTSAIVVDFEIEYELGPDSHT